MPVVMGVGVIIVNASGEVLFGQRCGSHAPYWSIPGGHMEPGEGFTEAAIREVAEETGLQLVAPQVIGISNNLETWRQEGKHTVSVCLLARHPGGEAQRKEPQKCAEWRWCAPDALPRPHFEASETAITLWQRGQFCLPDTA
ncbi:NUDIX domain-containing protein [Chimaeribacter arupi]|uniref:NUDIX domain-containing protein n=2 Tax=Yersiniaceae TaxID=1903411 RepID=A0A2N5EJC2_9GAMM|nr:MULTISPECIES: NUDIX domain-containing protein [Yersiniaceae]MBS0967774.1 NUDIX domain-containing protein [Nissabacter archeti]MDV5140785.1 NUDIX domain-containing protein [Chimaeribacter arupi]PLR39036.1 NUDIX domain-containing protein [Chimaeribacter arupi]PLR43936.1 NUDIX domain-containing protein [Chimaeribacter arupi]PLR45674.1 NUDIX domain-containing protein [Chimaeribacter arupi]